MSNNSHIVIANGASRVRKIEARNGKPAMFFNEQSAAIVKDGEDFPLPFTITLDDNAQPYAPGKYMVDPACLEVGDFNALKVGRRVKLLPLPASSASVK